MDMNAFFGIILSVMVLRWWWKNNYAKPRKPRIPDVPTAPMVQPRSDAQRQRDKDAEELRKQGYSEELIATILPTINNDGR